MAASTTSSAPSSAGAGRAADASATLWARFGVATLEEVFLDIARGRAREPEPAQ